MHGKRWVRYALCVSVATITTSMAVNPAAHQQMPAVTPDSSFVKPAALPMMAPMPMTSKPALTGIQTPTATTPPSNNAQLWNLKNADIRAVIQTISILTGKNFVIDPRVQGNITLVSQKAMTPDEMYQVFLSMLQLLQFSAIPSGKIIKIVPAMEANSLTHKIATNASPGRGEEIVVRVIPVQRVSATELVPVLRPLMPQSGSITAYLPSNSLILAGTASNINRITKVISEMDNENSNQVTVIPLRYANAKKVVTMIQALHSGSGQAGANNPTLVPDEEDNSILINANSTNQLLTQHLIAQLDQPEAGGDDTRVVMLNYLTAKKLAPILSKIASGMKTGAASSLGNGKSVVASSGDDDSGGSANGISIQAEEDNNALVIHAPRALMSSLIDVIHRLDRRPQEVLVEAIIVKVDENLLNKLGIEWGSPDGLVGAAVAAATGGTSALASIATPGDVALKVGSHGVGLLPNGNLIALLHLLKSDGSTDVLSTPSIVVLNNDKATIDDGQNIGVANTSFQGTPQSGTTTAAGSNTTLVTTPYNAIDRQDVTLSLDVTPHISPNQMIRMELLQKDDSIASDANATQDNPTLNTSKIKTSVLVKSGDVLVLGGLISNDQENINQKIPILGSLPIVGHLFSYTSHKIQKSSLMVFIRPIIMSKAPAKQQTMARYRYLREQQIGMQTEDVANFTRMTILPKLGDKTSAKLPPPVAPIVALPMPVETKK
ncbi:MAG: type II secretion system secretin GspD [Coxiellaceae bacterium]|nr:type II secretion system secretin GspD [Coxiellaceae bacterium]